LPPYLFAARFASEVWLGAIIPCYGPRDASDVLSFVVGSARRLIEAGGEM